MLERPTESDTSESPKQSGLPIGTLDALYGKHYEFDPLENKLVKVESGGDHIRVGIKNDEGALFSWWEPTHPFAPPPFDMPKQGDWDFKVEAHSTEVTRAVFRRGEEVHTLTITVTDPNASPKPVSIEWE